MMLRRLFFLLLPALVLASAASADGLGERVREHTLKNGMKLLMVERHSSPTVSAWIRYRVGSVDERSDERGLAHLLEHMLFKGTKTLGCTDYLKEKPLLDAIEATANEWMAEKAKRPVSDVARVAELEKKLHDLEEEAAKFSVKEEFFQIYARNGGTNYNAYTAKDGTTYMVSLPANKLELWAAIESDRMREPVLREFYTERAVVMEERRRSYDTDPEGKLWENFQSLAFSAHPYGQPIIGWMSDIENLSRTKAENFLRRYYAPNNAIVAIVGDIDTDRTIAMIEKYFADLKPGTAVAPVGVVEPPQAGEKRIEVAADAEPQLMMGWHKPTHPDPDDIVFDVIDMVLADGRTSRLYRKLVLEKQMATEVSAFSAPGNRYPNLFIVGASPRSPHTTKEVEDAVYEEVERLKKEPVSESELRQILNKLEYEEVHQMGSNGGLARNLTEYEATSGSWRYLIDHRKKVAEVTPADVMRVARTYLVKENRTVGSIVRKEVAQ
jgi:predicted Zn-dependent peptidase